MLKVQNDPPSYPFFKVHRGQLFFKDKLYISSNSPLKHVLLEELHISPLGGHSGIHKTYGRLSENVYWEGMKKDVTAFVNACKTCQFTKTPAQLPFGLFQPLPVLQGVWEDISLDFIIGLPSFQNHTMILVVVDRFSKVAHFGMLPSYITAIKVADLFAKMIYKLHGMPKSIVLDRDPIFLSHFWKELFRLSGTKLRISATYRPQSDNESKIINKML